jgi:hypothetical protein
MHELESSLEQAGKQNGTLFKSFALELLLLPPTQQYCVSPTLVCVPGQQTS